jgi:hypothetical protein
MIKKLHVHHIQVSDIVFHDFWVLKSYKMEYTKGILYNLAHARFFRFLVFLVLVMQNNNLVTRKVNF